MKLINKKSISVLFTLFLGCSVIGVASSFSYKENIKVSADSININDYTTANSYHNSGNASSLLTELRRLTSPGNPGSYSALWSTYLTAFVKSDGYIKDYYSSVSKFTSANQDPGKDGVEGTYYNREHSIPKSWWGGSTTGQGADPFIVVPTDKVVNGKRSNYPFGMVKSATYTSGGGYSKLGSSDSDTWGYSGTVFEPNDEVKGDLARNTLYAIAKYSASSGWTTGEGSAIFSGNANTNFGLTNYAVKLLTYWNNLDKPDAWEQGVNDRLAAIQGNRNPFIDHPEYVNTLWKDVSGMTPYGGDVPTPTPTGSVSISKTSISLTTGNTTTISATSSDSSTITWSTSDDTVVSLSSTSANSSVSITLTAEGEGEATITAEATIGGTSYTKTCSVTVTESGGFGEDDPPVGLTNVTYTVFSKTSVNSSGTPPTNSSAAYSQTYSTAKQMTGGNSATLTLSGYAGYIIKSLTLNMKSNSSSGEGTFSLTAGTTSLASIPTATTFNQWYGRTSYSNSYVDVNVTLTNNSYEIKNNEDVVVTIAATANSLYIQSYTFQYEAASSVQEVTLSSISASGETTEFTVGDTFAFGGTVTAHYSDNSTKDVTDIATFSGYDVSEEGEQTVTVSYAEDEITKTTTYQITVSKNSLSSISVSGQKTTFDVGDTFSFGGTVTATYLKGNNNDVTNSATFSGYNMSSSGNQTVTVSYTEDNVTKTTTYQITVNDIQPVIDGDAYTNSGVLTYYKVTSTNEIVSGKYYAIVYEAGPFMMDGSLTSLDSTSNKITTGSIVSSKFDVNSGTDSAFLITASGNNYTIKSKSGYYIGRTSNANGLDTSTSEEYKNSVSFDSDGNVTILSSGGAYLRYNSSSNQERFRYYKSASYTDQKAIQLYRIEVEKYVEDFFTYVQCDNGVTKPSNWTLMNSKYTPLSSASKTTLKNTVKNVNGNIVQRAVARYDYIVGKYLKTGLDVSYTDFLERNPAPVYENSYLPTYKREENEFVVIAVVVLSSSILCFTLLTYLKKKRK